MPRPIIIDLRAEQTVIKYTVGDDLSVTATVLETISGTKGPIVWGTAVGVGHVKEFDTDTSTAAVFTVDATVNGELTIFMSAATTKSLGSKKYRFSIQITRNSRKLTYWAGTLEPSLEATNP